MNLFWNLFLDDVVLLISGVVIGINGCRLYFLSRSAYGVLKINETNPEKDIYRLEIEDLDSLRKKKQIVLKIKK